MRRSDEIIRDIEREQAAALGKPAYEEFRGKLQAVVDSLATRPGEQETR